MRCVVFRKLILAASRPSTISLVRACRKAWISRNGIATVKAKAVLFIAIEIEADSISAFSAGLTADTAVKPWFELASFYRQVKLLYFAIFGFMGLVLFLVVLLVRPAGLLGKSRV